MCECVWTKGIHLLFVSNSLVWVREMNLRVEDASVCVCACVCVCVCVCVSRLTFVHTFESNSHLVSVHRDLQSVCSIFSFSM